MAISLLAAIAVSVSAQSENKASEPYTIWPVEQLTKPGSLGNYGHYRASIQRRDAGSEPEVHTDFAHVMFFTSGAGTFVLGGQIVDGPNGKKIVKGGESKPILLGAIYHIPANTVHWAVPDAGLAVTYFVTNINAPSTKTPAR